MKKTIILLFLLALALPVSASAAKEEKFEVPSVKDDYCGVEISFQNCKCAFHDKYCESAAKKDSWQSRIYVMEKFNFWIGGLIYEFGKKCIANGGEWNKPTLTCAYLDDAEKATKNSSNKSLEEKYSLPDLSFKPKPKSSTVRGKFQNADGEVFVWSAAFRKWTGPISAGTLIYNGDALMTTGRGEAMLIIYGTDGQDTVRLNKDTFLEIPDPTNFKKHDSSLWGILKGKALEVYNAATGSEVKIPSWYRQMQTTAIVVGTRGTHYIVTHDESTNTSKVFLNEGEADITSISGGDTVLLFAGEKYVYSNGDIATSTMSAKEWESVKIEYDFDEERTYVSKEDLIVPTDVPIDLSFNSVSKNEIVPDRNFFEEQIGSGKNYVWYIIIVLGLIAFVVYRLKFKKV